MVVDVFVKIIVVEETVVIKIADVIPDEVQYVVSETISLGDFSGHVAIVKVFQAAKKEIFQGKLR